MLQNECSRDCTKCGENLVCYIVDSSGYIIVGADNDITGKFFGEVEGDILESMLEEEIFQMKTLYDYQALCFLIFSNKTSSATRISTVSLINAIWI